MDSDNFLRASKNLGYFPVSVSVEFWRVAIEEYFPEGKSPIQAHQFVEKLSEEYAMCPDMSHEDYVQWDVESGKRAADISRYKKKKVHDPNGIRAANWFAAPKN